MNNKEKSYYANITKHLNSVYKSVELDIFVLSIFVCYE